MRGREPVIREDGAIEIPLTQGQVAIIDASDYHLVNGRLWQAHWAPCIRSFYAESCGRLKMHRVVLGLSLRHELADHRNHDTLDNRRNNLRVVSSTENKRNGSKPRVGSSRFKGVSWCRKCRRWRAQIRMSQSRRIALGFFSKEEDAARAYDASARELFGQFALTNTDLGLLDDQDSVEFPE
jgi:hypothetical protein